MLRKQKATAVVHVRNVPNTVVRALDAEAKSQDRSREAQMRFILAERYEGTK